MPPLPLNNNNKTNSSLLQWQQKHQRNLYTHYEKLTNHYNNHCNKFLSTLPNSNDSDSSSSDDDDDDSDSDINKATTTTANNNNNNNSIINHPQHTRLSTIRNVGIFAHVDAGKTTVTERMLALSGIVHDPGSVDTGDTVTDYLPAERERGITIQSAAVKFDWIVPPLNNNNIIGNVVAKSKSTREGNNAAKNTSSEEPTTTQKVSINLIDTPGHVDFSVEVHRSVAVLDGAVLVLDAVAGVQAQTETVWRAIRNTTDSRSSSSGSSETKIKKKSTIMHGSHEHEPLPTIMYINKMDRIGSDYNYAIGTVMKKLGGSNPLVIQLPLYHIETNSSSSSNEDVDVQLVVGTLDNPQPPNGNFVGVLDIVNMRTIVYPTNIEEKSMEEAVPIVTSLFDPSSLKNTDVNNSNSKKKLMDVAVNARRELISNLANVDEIMEDLYLHATLEQDDDDNVENIEDYITTDEIKASIQRMTLQRKVMPTLCGAALRGVGVEPLLDCVAEYRELLFFLEVCVYVWL